MNPIVWQIPITPRCASKEFPKVSSMNFRTSADAEKRLCSKNLDPSSGFVWPASRRSRKSRVSAAKRQPNSRHFSKPARRLGRTSESLFERLRRNRGGEFIPDECCHPNRFRVELMLIESFEIGRLDFPNRDTLESTHCFGPNENKLSHRWRKRAQQIQETVL